LIVVGRVRAIEIALHWRWAMGLPLGAWLLAQYVFPPRFPTWEPSALWTASAAAVLIGELVLLLHELSHAMVAHAFGRHGTRIVFHGFFAETVVDGPRPGPLQEAYIALAGPAMNLIQAGLAAAVRVALGTQGLVDMLLLCVLLSNAAMATMSLAPIGASDGQRALATLRRRARRRSEAEVPGQRQDDHDQDEQAEWRPTVVAPPSRRTIAASQ
jgi:hypothetical protein